MYFSKMMNTFEEGIFSKLNNKMKEQQALGKKIYNLFVGTPDFAPDPSIMEEVSKKSLIAENYKYSLAPLDELKEKFIKHYKRRFNVDLQKEEITTCNGTQEGMCHIGMLLCDPGDYVLLPDPGYVAFISACKLANANIINYPLLEENDFMPRLDLIDEEVLKKVRYVVISYPSNPTGGTITKERYLEIIALAKKYGFIIVNDNAYSDIVFDGNETFSFLSLPGAKEVGCEFYSLSKSYDVTGMRVSFFLGNKEIVDNFNKLRSQYDFGMFYPIQYGAMKCFEVSDEFIEKQRKTYESRRNALCDGLTAIGWNVPRSKGTMFVFARIPSHYKNSEEFTYDLLEKTGVLVNPGSSFGPLGDRYIRFALTLPKETIEEVVKIIANSGIVFD